MTGEPDRRRSHGDIGTGAATTAVLAASTASAPAEQTAPRRPLVPTQAGPLGVTRGAPPVPAETSGATTSLIIRHVRAHGGPDAVERLLERAQVPHCLAELADPSRWVSYDTRIRLFQAATSVLGDPYCPHAMGAAALRTGLYPSLVLLLRALGSPAQVYRQLPRSVPKFSTTSTMEVVEVGRTNATLRFTLHEGYRHSRLDCLYAQGLISVVPEIFGAPPATVVHHECQSDGFDACTYHLTWSRRRSRWRRGGTPVDHELQALRAQLDELQSAATDLVGTDDLSVLLHRITERAAAAVLAPSYLLALHDPDGGRPLVHSRGIEPGLADVLAQRLLAGEDLDDHAVVVDVASSRRVHGRLAALHAPGQQGPVQESTMLRAYAGHAAAALDLLTALDRSRRGESRSAALLTLAHDLRAATDPVTVARVVADALPGIVGCDTSTVFFWDTRAGWLQTIASAGLEQRDQDLLADVTIEPFDSPELAGILTSHEPSLMHADSSSPTVSRLMRALGVSDAIAMPLLAGGELLGIAAAAWRAPAVLGDAAEPLSRLRGVAEFAATALENARLLGTVRHQSLHDALTHLPNRVLFGHELDRALQHPDSAGRVAILFCDLDSFKHVNDVLGHAAGDELLRQAAGRLRTAVRPEDVVARLSGDEFAVLLEHLPSEETAADVARRVVAQLASPYHVEGLDLRVTTSVGVAVHGGRDAGASALLRAADSAMYAAKQRGRNQVAHAGRLDAATTGRDAEFPTFESELRAAPDHGQLRLDFQRLVDISNPPDEHGLVPTVGYEALIRWQHPSLGLLPPAAFLPLAEETGFIVELDLWAIGEACRALASWNGQDRSSGVHMAVNVSAPTLRDARLHETVREALVVNDLAPERLYLEIVESRSLVDLPGVVERLSALRRLGIRISLDDFGTGYSTLAWLQRLPVDQVKLDRSFTGAITEDSKSLALATGVLALVDELGLEVVAEGVETTEQLATLRMAGFTIAQGYLWGQPESGEQISRDAGAAVAVLDRSGQRHRERRRARRAVDVDRPAVGVHHRLDDGQAEPAGPAAG